MSDEMFLGRSTIELGDFRHPFFRVDRWSREFELIAESVGPPIQSSPALKLQHFQAISSGSVNCARPSRRHPGNEPESLIRNVLFGTVFSWR